MLLALRCLFTTANRFIRVALLVSLLCNALPGQTEKLLANRSRQPGQSDMLAPTPPMGWNSWDCYGTTVTEQEVKANADYMAQHLARYGWKYVVVDIQWYEPNAK